MSKDIEEFLNACDELINCKFLVAEYKLSKMLKALAGAQEVCALVGECLEQFNRDREFAKAYCEDNKGNFYISMPEEEYKVLALVFCTLVDIDGKKIDFTDFVRRFFGHDENAYESFVNTMIVPFKTLIESAFNFSEDKQEEGEADEEEEEPQTGDKFDLAQKVCVQILSELQFLKQDANVERVSMIARSIIKTASLEDEEVTSSLISAMKFYKVKQIRFMVRELLDAFDLS